MKKILITLLLVSISVQAVHVSSRGLGQVLLFPYYTVNNNLNSLINIMNTTENAKALRVRFREAANGKEVFAFNVYLGPNDQWVGGLYKSSDEYGTVTRMINADPSCTVPKLEGDSLLFYSDNYVNADAFGNDIERMYEGFVEVIEMGELSGNSAYATLIDSNQPEPDCAVLEQAWEENGYWLDDAATDLMPPAGGITGNIILIDVPSGIAVSQNPVILSDFSDEVLHTAAGSESPNLADSKTKSILIDSSVAGGWITEWETGYQAVSSVLMKENIYNEYVLSDSIGANTEWVVTLPTRQYHTNQDSYPFDYNEHTPDDCEVFYVTGLYDREEQYGIGDPDDIIPGVPPPSIIPTTPSLCYAANTLEFFDEQVETGNTAILGSHYSFPIDTQKNSVPEYFRTGHISITFAGITVGGRPVDHYMVDRDENVVEGLPVIGFALQRYVNASAPGGSRNYAGIFQQQSSVSVFPNPSNSSQNTLDGMSVSSDNIGEVLIYPYYTVNNGLNSLISVVNTTDLVKAVKVRFLEGKNSRECLSFNLYLSPYDVWTAGLDATTATEANAGEGFAGQNSVKLITNDTSCTVPAVNGVEFLPNRLNDGLGLDLQRCREGHIEIIEMGTVEDTLNNNNAAWSVTHGEPGYINEGVPNSCGNILENWDADSGGYWATVDINDGIVPPLDTGGLYGNMSVIDVDDGVDISYTATAISNYNQYSQHTAPGDDLPNLSSGSMRSTLVETEQGMIETTWSKSIDAVSALFMSSGQYNDFVISEGINAESEWVMTYPTKRFYVDPEFSGSLLPLPPFKTGLTSEYGACEYFRFKAFDRNQKLNASEGTPPAPDPLPPNYNIYPEFCWSANVIDLNQGQNENTILGSQLIINDWMSDPLYSSPSAMPFDTGWMQADFSNEVINPVPLIGINQNGEVHKYYGKPGIGMVFQKYVNGSTGDPDNRTVANYAVANINKFVRSIVITEE